MPGSRKKTNKVIIQRVSLTLFFCLFSAAVYAADTTPPTGSISINNNAAYTNSINVTLNLLAQDASSGVAQMKFSNNNSAWTTPETYNTTKAWVLSSGSGIKRVYVKYKDNAGNWSRAYSDSIILDTTLPRGSIKINNNAAKTNSTQVTLNLSAIDSYSGVSRMHFSNDNSTWSSLEAYATTKTWNIPAGDGTKNVYVKFRDKAGNWSVVYSDTIILDTTAPVISNLRALNITTNSASIAWDTDEPATGQVEYGLTTAYGYKSSISSSLVTSRSIAVKSLKEYTTYHYRAISKDSVGNQAVSDDFTFTTKDSTAPTGSIKINNGATATNSINVTLNLSAQDSGSGVAQMKFSNNNSTWLTPEPYTTTKAWVLSSGSGIKRVYVKYKDSAGNWSATYSDSISLPNQTPQVGTVGPSSGTSVPDEAVIFSTTYSDSNGWEDIKYAYFLINTSISGLNCLYVYYDQNTNKLYLRNNTNSRWLGGYAPASANIIENSYAKLNCAQTAVSGSGTTLTVNWNIAFKSTFTGVKNTYLYVKDDANAYQGWVQKGTWTINQILSISITPKFWNIGSTEINKVITMAQANKITVTNDGSGPETFELKLTNPSGWTASTVPGEERYVLSGLFCNAGDIPQASHFNQDAISEDIITTNSIKATNTVFAYDQSTANGASVPSAGKRSLYLQFKSPTVTQKKEEQNISVIVSCQIP